jgi:acyl-CoA synthetase (AMP-forming)/AMP-acid ligase II
MILKGNKIMSLPTYHENLITEVLNQHAQQTPGKTAYTFITDDKENALTYKELQTKSQAFASYLQKQSQPGERVLILLPPGLDYIVTFLGCLYAGMIAVPAYPPSSSHHQKRLTSLQDDAQTSVVVTLSETQQKNNFLTNVLLIDKLNLDDNSNYSSFFPDLQSIAFLQYTSGSTNNPKGVMVSHFNLIVNCHAMEKNAVMDAKNEAVFSWLLIMIWD